MLNQRMVKNYNLAHRFWSFLSGDNLSAGTLRFFLVVLYHLLPLISIRFETFFPGAGEAESSADSSV